jgi:hypothetical protein
MLSKIFSAGAGDLIKKVGGVIDNLHTSAEEKAAAEKQIKDMILGYEAEIIATVLLIFIDAGVLSFQVQDKWTDLLQLVLITVIGAYFGGRSLEKVKK